jgi:UDP-N-acetylmuramate--alanine ligase
MSDDKNASHVNAPFAGLQSVYFIGIGGIGMSALARFFHTQGVKVSGYDKTSTALTRQLSDSGIAIHYEENIALLPAQVDLVVYTPAIPPTHKELVHYREAGTRVVKRSDVLQIISEGSFNICIAGTHGKTTITTMVAHILRDTGYGCNAFLGGISANYGTNFWSDPRNVCVIEADEYDRSFLKLSPDIAIISAMDADHLDIYGDAATMEEAFIDFSKKIKPGGVLIYQAGLPKSNDLVADQKISYTAYGQNAGTVAENIRTTEGGYVFDARVGDKLFENVVLNMGGLHNVENMLAAITVASSLHIDEVKIKAAVASFKGVKRRFEYIVPPASQADIVYIDDYAHHPEELRPLITGAKQLFANRKCTIIFQPHLFSRTRDFADGFAEVLDMADEIILLPIYPARELPIAGVTSEMLLERMKNSNKRILPKEEVMNWLQEEYVSGAKNEKQLLITAGAGDVDTLVPLIKTYLTE